MQPLHSMWWRRVAMASAATLCLLRALAYVPWVRSGPVAEPVWMAAAGKPWLVGVYAVAWAVAGCICLVAMVTGRLLTACSAVAGMMSLWGIAYLLAWVLQPWMLWWTMAGLYLPAGWCIGTLGVILTRRDLLEEALVDG